MFASFSLEVFYTVHFLIVDLYSNKNAPYLVDYSHNIVTAKSFHCVRESFSHFYANGVYYNSCSYTVFFCLRPIKSV
jgi:hypothetical protein